MLQAQEKAAVIKRLLKMHYLIKDAQSIPFTVIQTIPAKYAAPKIPIPAIMVKNSFQNLTCG